MVHIALLNKQKDVDAPEFCQEYVRSFRGADCDTDHYLVAAKVRDRLAVSKRAASKTETDRFNVKKLNQADVREQYQVTIRKSWQLRKS
jgi:hypothetical protein